MFTRENELPMIPRFCQSITRLLQIVDKLQLITFQKTAFSYVLTRSSPKKTQHRSSTTRTTSLNRVPRKPPPDDAMLQVTSAQENKMISYHNQSISSYQSTSDFSFSLLFPFPQDGVLKVMGKNNLDEIRKKRNPPTKER